MKLDLKFWQGKRVLVTGHTGFKGAWLCAWLHRLQAEVCGLALPPDTTPNLFEITRLDHRIKNIFADIREAELLRTAIAGFAPEIVLHLAAQSLVRRSYAQPMETFATNVMGTINLLQAVRESPSVRAVVVVTSDKCYQNSEWPWPYRESDTLGGRDPYSASKACVEIATAAWRASFFASEHGPAVATARAGNVIGGGDWASDRLVPDCLSALQAGKTIRIRNPNATRPWQHVLEPLSGYLRLAECLYTNGEFFQKAWNFGPSNDDVRPVSDIASAICAQWGDNASWQVAAEPSVAEAVCLAVDSSLAKHELGWRPQLGVDEALRWTIDWYRDLQRGATPADLVETQIARYQNLLGTL